MNFDEEVISDAVVEDDVKFFAYHPGEENQSTTSTNNNSNSGNKPNPLSFPSLSDIITSNATQQSNGVDFTGFPGLPTIPGFAVPKAPPTAEDMANLETALNNPSNIREVLSKIGETPEQLGQVMAQTMPNMSPDMLEKAKKMAMSSQGAAVIRELAKQGISPQQAQQNMRDAMPKIVKTGKKFTGVVITASRKIKTHEYQDKDDIYRIIQCKNPIENMCPRLATGPLKGKSIKAYYDGAQSTKNRRTTKIMGFPVGGSTFFIIPDNDLGLEAFTKAEDNIS